jgi:putative oligomerization/nucleic acid binding protein
MLGRRRRPLLRAAAVGGAGYAVGKRRQGRDGDEGEDPAALDESAATEEPGSPPGAPDPAVFDELKKLGDLKATGVLTQSEFDEQKRKLLQST